MIEPSQDVRTGGIFRPRFSCQVLTRPVISPTRPFPTNPLPRHSLPCASLPPASFEAPLSCLIDLIPNFKAYVVGAELEIVDDCPFDFRSECSQDGRCQIVGERAFLLRALHEHRDRRPDALIDENDESFSWLPSKTAKPSLVAAMAWMCTSTTGLLILQVSIRIHAKIRITSSHRRTTGCIANALNF